MSTGVEGQLGFAGFESYYAASLEHVEPTETELSPFDPDGEYTEEDLRRYVDAGDPTAVKIYNFLIEHGWPQLGIDE